MKVNFEEKMKILEEINVKLNRFYNELSDAEDPFEDTALSEDEKEEIRLKIEQLESQKNDIYKELYEEKIKSFSNFFNNIIIKSMFDVIGNDYQFKYLLVSLIEKNPIICTDEEITKKVYKYLGIYFSGREDRIHTLLKIDENVFKNIELLKLIDSGVFLSIHKVLQSNILMSNVDFVNYFLEQIKNEKITYGQHYLYIENMEAALNEKLPYEFVLSIGNEKEFLTYLSRNKKKVLDYITMIDNEQLKLEILSYLFISNKQDDDCLICNRNFGLCDDEKKENLKAYLTLLETQKEIEDDTKKIDEKKMLKAYESLISLIDLIDDETIRSLLNTDGKEKNTVDNSKNFNYNSFLRTIRTINILLSLDSKEKKERLIDLLEKEEIRLDLSKKESLYSTCLLELVNNEDSDLYFIVKKLLEKNLNDANLKDEVALKQILPFIFKITSLDKFYFYKDDKLVETPITFYEQFLANALCGNYLGQCIYADGNPTGMPFYDGKMISCLIDERLIDASIRTIELGINKKSDYNIENEIRWNELFYQARYYEYEDVPFQKIKKNYN